MTKPASVSVGGGSTGSPHIGGMFTPLMLLGGNFRLCLLGGGVLPSWYYETCLPRRPGCCRWPRWPMWDVVSTVSRNSGTVRAFGSGSMLLLISLCLFLRLRVGT